MSIGILIPPRNGHVFRFKMKKNVNTDFITIEMYICFNKDIFEIEEKKVIKNFIDNPGGFRKFAKSNNYYCYKDFEIEFADSDGERSGEKRKLMVKINNESVNFLYDFMVNNAIFILEKE